MDFANKNYKDQATTKTEAETTGHDTHNTTTWEVEDQNVTLSYIRSCLKQRSWI